MANGKELESIVQRMIDAGESEENIATVVKAYSPEVKKKTLLDKIQRFLQSLHKRVETRLAYLWWREGREDCSDNDISSC